MNDFTSLNDSPGEQGTSLLRRSFLDTGLAWIRLTRALEDGNIKDRDAGKETNSTWYNDLDGEVVPARLQRDIRRLGCRLHVRDFA